MLFEGDEALINNGFRVTFAIPQKSNLFIVVLLVLKNFQRELYFTFQSKEQNLSKHYIVSLLTQLKEWLHFTYNLMVMKNTAKDTQHVTENTSMKK